MVPLIAFVTVYEVRLRINVYPVIVKPLLFTILFTITLPETSVFPFTSREYPEVIEFFPTPIGFENVLDPPMDWVDVKSTNVPEPLFNAPVGMVPEAILLPYIVGALVPKFII